MAHVTGRGCVERRKHAGRGHSAGRGAQCRGEHMMPGGPQGRGCQVWRKLRGRGTQCRRKGRVVWWGGTGERVHGVGENM